MIATDLNQLREYIVTVKKDIDWRTVHNELIVDTSANDSVDSNIIPDRNCEVAQERANNPRNTHYTLSESEAINLRKDSRILAVQALDLIPEPKPRALQNGNFNRTSSSAGSQDNWGLLRHINQTNTFNNSTADPGGTYDYVLDGTGVDQVIVDTGIQVGHPEWEDANGVSRLKQVNWPTISGEVFTQPANFYTDTNGHGTHCIGTMAGKTFGWCKNSKAEQYSRLATVLVGSLNAYPLGRTKGGGLGCGSPGCPLPRFLLGVCCPEGMLPPGAVAGGR